MAVLVLVGFVYWLLAPTSGGRWALVTATLHFDGSVSGVSGSFWHGLKIGHLDLPTASFTIRLNDFDLRVQWPRLLERELHIQNLSASQLHAAMSQHDTPEDDSPPFEMPTLPVELRIERLALDQLSLTINQEPIPVQIADLAGSLYVGANHGQIKLNSLVLEHAQIHAKLKADARVLQLNEPWPFDVELQAEIQGQGAGSILCARRYVPTLPAASDAFEPCAANLHVLAKGDQDEASVTAWATGQGMDLDA